LSHPVDATTARTLGGSLHAASDPASAADHARRAPERPGVEAADAADTAALADLPDGFDGDLHDPDVLVQRVLASVAEAFGFVVWWAEWAGSGRGRRLQLYLDRPGAPSEPPAGAPDAAAPDRAAGVSLDDCIRMSRVLGQALDTAEVIAAHRMGRVAPAVATDGEAGSPAAAAAEIPEWAPGLPVPRVDGDTAPLVAAMLGTPYTLEVSSPGLDRPLVRHEHFARFVGRAVVLRTRGPLSEASKQRKFHGVIVAVTPSDPAPQPASAVLVTLREGDTGAEHHIPLERIQRANLVYDATKAT
jgi:ribosome maturation factor RimP